MNGERKTSPWVYVAMGCAAVLVLSIGGLSVIGFFGYRWAKRMESEIKDPATRALKVKRVLGCERLPDGYHPMISVSLPFVMDMALLSDRPPSEKGEPGGFDERGFVYLEMFNPQFNEGQMRDYFEGKTNDPSILRRSGIHLDVRSKEVLRRGVFESGGYGVMYLSQRGQLEVDQGRADGINALMLVDCPEDTRMRMAVWFGPDPDPAAGAGSIELAGSPADEEALRAFMGHFRLCRRP